MNIGTIVDRTSIDTILHAGIKGHERGVLSWEREGDSINFYVIATSIHKDHDHVEVSFQVPVSVVE